MSSSVRRSDGAEGIDLSSGALNKAGRTVVLITHNPEVAEVATRRIHLLDGLVVEEERLAA